MPDDNKEAYSTVDSWAHRGGLIPSERILIELHKRVGRRRLRDDAALRASMAAGTLWQSRLFDAEERVRRMLAFMNYRSGGSAIGEKMLNGGGHGSQQS